MHPYYYFRNGQNNVIGLFDGNRNIVARYSYDSRGNLLSIKDGSGSDKTNDTTFVGYKNPLRYRGYYYDSETKLYYLQSRYYNPEWGRFINADAIIINTLNGTNIFSYCNNNPVMLVDPSGNCPYCKNPYYHASSMPWSAYQRHVESCSKKQFISSVNPNKDYSLPKQSSFIEKVGATVIGIIKSDLNSFQAEISGGLGLGGGVETIYNGIPVGIEAKAVVEGYYSCQGGQFSKGNRYGAVASAQIALLSYTAGKYGYFNVTGSEPSPYSDDITFGFGISGYLVIGGSASLEYNISEAWRGAISVFKEVWG